MEVAADTAEQGGGYLSWSMAEPGRCQGAAKAKMGSYLGPQYQVCLMRCGSNGSITYSNPLKRNPFQQSAPAHSDQTSTPLACPGIIMKTTYPHSQGCPNLNGELDGHL